MFPVALHAALDGLVTTTADTSTVMGDVLKEADRLRAEQLANIDRLDKLAKQESRTNDEREEAAVSSKN